jgi:hypothetical protein
MGTDMKRTQERRQRLFSELARLQGPDYGLKDSQRMAIRRGWRYVRWAARKSLELPPSGAPAEAAFGNHAFISRMPAQLASAVAGYLATKLDVISRQSKPYRFEQEMTPGMLAQVFAAAGLERSVAYVRSRRQIGGPWARGLVTLLPARSALPASSFHPEAPLAALLAEMAEWFPRHTNPRDDWSAYREMFAPLVAAARPRRNSHHDWRSWLERFLLYRYQQELSREPDALGDLAALTLEDGQCQQIVKQLGTSGLARIVGWSPPLFARLSAAASEQIVEAVGTLWDHRSFEKVEWSWCAKDEWGNLKPLQAVLPHLETPALAGLARHLGLYLGLRFVKEGLRIDTDGKALASRCRNLRLPTPPEFPKAVVAQATLWRGLQVLAQYEAEYGRSETERLGLRTELMELAAREPEAWVLALSWVLEASHHLAGFAEAVTVALASDSAAIGDELRRLADGGAGRVRDRARGIAALVQGLADPAEKLAEDLLSFAVRQLDGTPLLPQPLATTSSTWLDSQNLEALLRASGVEAEAKFREYFTTQGGIEEEAVTGRLLAELERAGALAQARLRGLGARTGRSPTAVFSHRQVPKKEERTYGCDVAFVVKIDGHRVKGTESAELVQVKKPERRRGSKAFAPRWRIAKQQLADILRSSGSAAYWLLGTEGEILVVPAKVLQALIPTAGWRQKAETEGDFSVDYFKIRSAAIPLAQFLVDLVLGLWLGRSDTEAVQFAKGEGRTTSPRHIFEIAVALGGGQHG